MGLTEFLTAGMVGFLLLMLYCIMRRVEVRLPQYKVNKKGNLYTVILRVLIPPKIRR